MNLEGYLRRIGVARRAPGREALDELHEAHVRAFTFDNIDVVLEQHPGVALDVVAHKFVARGRGGYCFEHATLLAAALELLGYQIVRRLARVGDPADGTQQGRTHMVIEVRLDGKRLLCDPGFAMSVLRPIPLADGAVDDHGGWAYRVRKEPEQGGWVLQRRHDDAWQVMHTTDELAVLPVDIVVGHHYTSTAPASIFTNGLVLTRHQPGRHVTVTHETVTIRRPGEETEHRKLEDGELGEWLTELDVPLQRAERELLLDRLARQRFGPQRL